MVIAFSLNQDVFTRYQSELGKWYFSEFIVYLDIRERLEVKETLVQKIYQRQHIWLGHISRMNNTSIATFAREGKVKDKRRVGKSKISWLSTALKM